MGSGTMGMGIAAACAQTGCEVLLLDIEQQFADKAVERMLAGRSPALDDPAKQKLITTGSFDSDLHKVADADWLCEAIVEDLDTKRNLFTQLEAARSDGSVISTNTSGIPLRSICEGMPDRLQHDVFVTHFFNPVKVMRLMELVPGAQATPEATQKLARFCGERLGKGVVYAKDTVNFIGNRIGCFWMFVGLHAGRTGRADGLTIETADALLSAPVGLPATGMYGLVDLIGLDVMDLVGKNLEENLADSDPGRAYVRLPVEEQAMLKKGQLGRKSGGGFYRVTKNEDGSKLKETFDIAAQSWRESVPIALDPTHSELKSLLYSDDLEGRFAWDVMSATCCYAADLVPEISDDIVNIDRAMRWGFNWQQGPFELIDALDPAEFATRLTAEGRPVPRMLSVLKASGASTFYTNGEFMGLDGNFHPLPPE
jgi:3-hydroxyacyl-CoA dehydrogenase